MMLGEEALRKNVCIKMAILRKKKIHANAIRKKQLSVLKARADLKWI